MICEICDVNETDNHDGIPLEITINRMKETYDEVGDRYKHNKGKHNTNPDRKT